VIPKKKVVKKRPKKVVKKIKPKAEPKKTIKAKKIIKKESIKKEPVKKVELKKSLEPSVESKTPLEIKKQEAPRKESPWLNWAYVVLVILVGVAYYYFRKLKKLYDQY
jgi:hypothetical protein